MFTSPSFAVHSEDEVTCPSVELQILGLTRTQPGVVQDEFNRIVKTSCWNLKSQSFFEEILWEMGIFSEIRFSSCPVKKNCQRLELKERWTTIPILKFSSGGGVQQTIVGVFDPNAFGKFLELGTQLEFLSGQTSGVLWFKNPRFLRRRILFDAQYWDFNRVRMIYDPQSEEPLLRSGFVQKQEKIRLALEPEISWNRKLIFGLENHRNRFSREDLSDDLKSMSKNSDLPKSTEVVFGVLGFELGRRITKSFQSEGTSLRVVGNFGRLKSSGSKNFYRSEADLRSSVILNNFWNLNQRVLLGSTDSENLDYSFFMGGLDRIRGFADNRFVGRNYALSNSELRAPLIRRSLYVIQGNLFIDALGFGTKWDSLKGVDALSVGGGLRLVLPKVYRFTGRIDFGQSLVGRGEKQVSFGVQQFF